MVPVPIGLSVIGQQRGLLHCMKNRFPIFQPLTMHLVLPLYG